MSGSIYENHIMKNDLVPFIFHRDTNRKNLNSDNALFNWHTNIEIQKITKGRGFVKLDDRIYQVTCGDIVVINSDVIHETFSDGKAYIGYDCLIMDSDFCKSSGIDTSHWVFEEIIRDDELSGLYDSFTESFQKCKGKHTPGDIAICRGRASLFLAELFDKHRLSQKTPAETTNTPEDYVKKTMSYIYDNYKNDLKVEDIAKYLSVSHEHLTRVFKKYTGTTITFQINYVRCMMAKLMIKDGCSVSESAMRCGYTNLSYFSKTYKKFIGELPSCEINKNKISGR